MTPSDPIYHAMRAMDAIFAQESRAKALQEEIGDCMKCDDAELANALQIFDAKTCKLIMGAMIRRDYQVVGEVFCLAWNDYCDSVVAQMKEPKQ